MISSRRTTTASVTAARTGAGTAGCKDLTISGAALRCLAKSMLRSKPYSENTRNALRPECSSNPNSALIAAASKGAGAASAVLPSAAAAAVLLSLTGANGYRTERKKKKEDDENEEEGACCTTKLKE
jgi:hypothetical protein